MLRATLLHLPVDVDLGHFLRYSLVGGEGRQVRDGRVQLPHLFPSSLFRFKPMLKYSIELLHHGESSKDVPLLPLPAPFPTRPKCWSCE